MHAQRLAEKGIVPIAQHDTAAVNAAAARADVVYDATGGSLAETILSVMPEAGTFVCYGLLSGQTFRQQRPLPRVAWFHIRNYLDALSAEAWQAEFRRIWPKLRASQCSDVYPLPAVGMAAGSEATIAKRKNGQAHAVDGQLIGLMAHVAQQYSDTLSTGGLLQANFDNNCQRNGEQHADRPEQPAPENQGQEHNKG